MNLKQLIESKNIPSDALDGLVHDAASRMASRANNEGVSEQLDFLSQAGFTDQEISEELGLSLEGESRS